MTKSDVINLVGGLNRVNNLRGVKFAYAVAKNLATLKSEIESLQKAQELTPEFQEYEKIRIKEIEKVADKDEKGKPIIVDKNYQIADMPAWEKKLAKLESEHQAVVDARKKQIEEYNALLKTESDVKLHKVKLEDVPQDITSGQLNAIISIIEE